MAENKMAELSKKIFGVELHEKFKLKYDNGKISDYEYHFAESGLYYDNHLFNDILSDILTGKYQIVKLPYKPAVGDYYWTYAKNSDNNRTLYAIEHIWSNDVVDRLFYRHGLCYKTKEEADEHLPRAEKYFNSDEIINWE